MTGFTRKLLDYWLEAVCLAALLVIIPPGWISAWTWQAGMRWLYVALVAFLSVNTLMPLVIRAAPVVGAMDFPDARKIHQRPIPRLGGLVVFAAVLFAVWRSQMFSKELAVIMTAGSVIFVMGLVDDIRGLSATTRLCGQVLAALIIAWGGMRFATRIPPAYLVSYAVTIIWLVGITNAFNFLDGIDGLAGGMGVICSLFFMAIAWDSRQMELAFLAAALMGACAGFLKSNWYPAEVFLGDCGSTFIGFMLAAMAVYGGWATRNPVVAISTPILILGVPIFDMIYITLSRVRRGDVRNLKEWIDYVGQDHFHHRLLHLGLSTKQAVFFILTVNMILGLAAWSMHYTSSTLSSVLLLAQSGLIFLIIVVLMLLGRDIKGGPSVRF